MKKDRTREIVQATMQDRIDTVIGGFGWDMDIEGYERMDRLRRSRPQWDDRRLHHSAARPKVAAARPKNRKRWCS